MRWCLSAGIGIQVVYSVITKNIPLRTVQDLKRRKYINVFRFSGTIRTGMDDGPWIFDTGSERNEQISRDFQPRIGV